MQQLSSKSFLCLGITLGIISIIIIGILIFIQKKETYKVSATEDNPCSNNYCGTPPWTYTTQQGKECVCSAGWQPTILYHGFANCAEIIYPNLPNGGYATFTTQDTCNSTFPAKCYSGYTGSDCNTIQLMTSLYPTNPVPDNVLSELAPDYLILLPGPGAEIEFVPESDIKWGRLYENDNGSSTNSYIYGCATVGSCLYVKNIWNSDGSRGRGYIFGTSGVFDTTINVYFRVKNMKTGSTLYPAHIFYDGDGGNFVYSGSDEDRTYGNNITSFNTVRGDDPTIYGPIPTYKGPGVIIAGIISS